MGIIQDAEYTDGIDRGYIADKAQMKGKYDIFVTNVRIMIFETVNPFFDWAIKNYINLEVGELISSWRSKKETKRLLSMSLNRLASLPKLIVSYDINSIKQIQISNDKLVRRSTLKIEFCNNNKRYFHIDYEKVEVIRSMLNRVLGADKILSD